MKKLLFFALALFFAPAFALMPPQSAQAVLGIADGWDTSHVTLSLVEKTADGQWVRTLGPIHARLGNAGLVWGRGLHTAPRGATLKREGDGRSPAGIFPIGGLWVTNKTPVKHHRGIPEVKVGPCDLWVSDPSTPHLYNRYVRLKRPASTPWELKEQMRQTDYAHSIKLLICHNTVEIPGCPIPGAGSSIFFHIWRRDGAAPTAGCTAMAEADLRALIARLRPECHPVYILLPKNVYASLRNSWKLP